MAVKLPILQAQDPVVNRYQTQLQGVLAPITGNPAAVAQLIMMNGSPNITLTTGAPNIIPIGLSAPLQGWFLIRNKSSSIVWDSQDGNQTPSQNLILNTSANTVIQLMVF